MALTLVLTAVLFSLAGLLNAVFAKTFDDISLIPTFVLTPLTYLGGVFYSLTLLPPFWQGLSHLNPIVYMISGFRYGFWAFTMFRWSPRLACWWCLSLRFICCAGT